MLILAFSSYDRITELVKNWFLLTKIESITEAESTDGAVRCKPAYMDEHFNTFV